MALLACKELTRRPWLEGIDLEVGRGEIVVLTGPSGSGKTLLLRALADLDPCDAGEVRLDGVRRRDLPPARWRRCVLYVHPGGVRLPGTVAADLERVGRLAAADGAGADALPALPAASPALDDRADTGSLSSGEAQVLALRRALSCAPDVLLLDEATAHLDPEAASGWERWLRAWADGGRGILWVSHDCALADRLGARRIDWS